MQHRILLGCGAIAAVWCGRVWISSGVQGIPATATSTRPSASGPPGCADRTFMLLASGIPYVVLMSAFAAVSGARLTGDGRNASSPPWCSAEVIWGLHGRTGLPDGHRGHGSRCATRCMPGTESACRSVRVGGRLRFPIVRAKVPPLLVRDARRPFWVSGGLTALQAPHVPANEPTPGSGSRSASTPSCPCCGSRCGHRSPADRGVRSHPGPC